MQNDIMPETKESKIIKKAIIKNKKQIKKLYRRMCYKEQKNQGGDVLCPSKNTKIIMI